MKPLDAWFKEHPRRFGVTIGAIVGMQTTALTWISLRVLLPSGRFNPYPALLQAIVVGLVTGCLMSYIRAATRRRMNRPG